MIHCSIFRSDCLVNRLRIKNKKKYNFVGSLRVGERRRPTGSVKRMTDFLGRTTDTHLTANQNNGNIDKCDGGELSEENYSDDSSGLKGSDSSSSGSWSIDDSIEFLHTSYKPLFDELPTFSLRSISPNGRSMSPITNEPISLFNLSISPISSLEDLTRMNDQSVLGNIGSNVVDVSCGKFAKDLTAASEDCVSNYDENERISLDDITASINTPPPVLSQSRGSNKRLNLETIFEGVFLETPPKKRKFDSRRTAHKYNEITTERISSYVIEQRQQQLHSNDSTNGLCNVFDDKINLNN